MAATIDALGGSLNPVLRACRDKNPGPLSVGNERGRGHARSFSGRQATARTSTLAFHRPVEL
jgi:hypothetical protein